jgi:hypothetical protein
VSWRTEGTVEAVAIGEALLTRPAALDQIGTRGEGTGDMLKSEGRVKRYAGNGWTERNGIKGIEVRLRVGEGEEDGGGRVGGGGFDIDAVLRMGLVERASEGLSCGGSSLQGGEEVKGKSTAG